MKTALFILLGLLVVSVCGIPQQKECMAEIAAELEVPCPDRYSAFSLTPQEMLEDIAMHADDAISCMNLVDYLLIQLLTEDLLSSGLVSVTDTEAHDTLGEIWERSFPDSVPTDPILRSGHWFTIAQDLDTFPTPGDKDDK